MQSNGNQSYRPSVVKKLEYMLQTETMNENEKETLGEAYQKLTTTSDKLGKSAHGNFIGQPLTSAQTEEAERRQISDINYVCSRQNVGLCISLGLMAVVIIGLIIIGVVILDTIL